MTSTTGGPNLKAAIIPVTPLQQNCSLLFDETTKEGIIVDPGGDVDRIRNVLDRTGVTVSTILLTHGHIDHAGGAMELKEALGGEAPILGPGEEDRFLLEGLALQGRQYGIAGARDCEPDRFLKEGGELVLLGESFEILHCPGHSPGHLVYANRRMNFAFMGDVLFQGSIGRTDFPYGDHQALLDAIRDKILPLGDAMAFICGHGPGSTIGAERVGNPFLQDM
ncbi:MAG: MBL fold metallo-hydrolase [Geminicoccaceae bacterium]